MSISVLWTAFSCYFQNYMGGETHRGFVGGARPFRSLKTSQRCLQHLGAFMMSICFGGKVPFRWDRANLKFQTEWFLGRCTSKLFSQVYDLPQRPGWVPNYTKSSFSSPCCLAYAVSIKGFKEMQSNILINSILDPFFPLNIIDEGNSEACEWQYYKTLSFTVSFLFSGESQAWLVSLRFPDFNQIPLESLKLLGNSEFVMENN